MNIRRRQFLRSSLFSGAAAVIPSWMRAEEMTGGWDLVAVKGADRVTMLDAALVALGGLKSLVGSGKRVLVKPNIGWDIVPERAANTHPDLVGAVVGRCVAAGAREVLVADHTCDEWKRCYRTSGIREAVEAAGGRMVPGNDAALYRAFRCPVVQLLKEGEAHELYLDCEVVINVPVLKHHSGAGMTAGVKNLMGMVWDRQFYHRADLQRCIAEFLYVRKPELTILDAWSPIIRHGPRGKGIEDTVEMMTLVASRDVVAADAAAARLLGLEPEKVGHVRMAAVLGFGRMDLDNLNIARLVL